MFTRSSGHFERIIPRYFSNDDVAHVGDQTIFIPLF